MADPPPGRRTEVDEDVERGDGAEQAGRGDREVDLVGPRPEEAGRSSRRLRGEDGAGETPERSLEEPQREQVGERGDDEEPRVLDPEQERQRKPGDGPHREPGGDEYGRRARREEEVQEVGLPAVPEVEEEREQPEGAEGDREQGPRRLPHRPRLEGRREGVEPRNPGDPPAPRTGVVDSHGEDVPARDRGARRRELVDPLDDRRLVVVGRELSRPPDRLAVEEDLVDVPDLRTDEGERHDRERRVEVDRDAIPARSVSRNTRVLPVAGHRDQLEREGVQVGDATGRVAEGELPRPGEARREPLDPQDVRLPAGGGRGGDRREGEESRERDERPRDHSGQHRPFAAARQRKGAPREGALAATGG